MFWVDCCEEYDFIFHVRRSQMRTILANQNLDGMLVGQLRNLHGWIYDDSVSWNLIQKIVHSYCERDAFSEYIDYLDIIHNYKLFLSIS